MSPFDVTVEEQQEEVQPQNQQVQNQTQPQPSQTGATPQGSARASQIEAEIKELTKAGSAYWRTRDPKGDREHKEAVARVTALHTALAGLKEGTDAKLDKAGQPDPKASTLSEPRPGDWDANNGRENEAGFRSLASELGLPREMVDGAVSEIAKAGVGQAYATFEEAEAAAMKAWGGDYEATLAHVHEAVKAAGPEVRAYLEAAGLDRNIAVLNYLAKMGREMVTAKTALGKLQADPRYTDSSHAEHKLAVLEAQRLHKILAPFTRDLR